MQEHVLRTVPELTERKQELQATTKRIHGACHDIEYALGEIEQMHSITSLVSFHVDWVQRAKPNSSSPHCAI